VGVRRGTEPIGVVVELYAAVRDGRVADVLALVDPAVACFPVVRPGHSVYEGHEGMARLVATMHAVHGDYQIEIDKITCQAGEPAAAAQVTVEARILPGPGHRPAAVPVTTVYAVRGGLITLIESGPGTSAAPSTGAGTGPGGQAAAGEAG
jgi:hypothetical protein